MPAIYNGTLTSIAEEFAAAPKTESIQWNRGKELPVGLLVWQTGRWTLVRGKVAYKHGPPEYVGVGDCVRVVDQRLVIERR